MEKELKPADYKAYINYGQVGEIRQVKKAYFYTDETSNEEATFNGVESVINVLARFNYELVEIVQFFFTKRIKLLSLKKWSP